MNRCPNCGFENADKALFCAECGSKLTQAEVSSESQQSEEPDHMAAFSVQTGDAEDSEEKETLRGLKTGIFLKAGVTAALAGVCFAVGLFARQLLPAAAATAELEIRHDPVSMAAALCFDADGYTNIGKLTVAGPQGQVLDTIEQVKEGCYRWIAPYRSVVYSDSQDGLYLKGVEDQEAVCLTEKTDWSSLEVSRDGTFLVYSDLSEEEDTAVVYDLGDREEKAVVEGKVNVPVYDDETGTFYYLNSDNTLMAIDDSGESRRIKGDVGRFEVQNGLLTCSTMAGKGYIIGEEEISPGGSIAAAAWGNPDSNQYFALVYDDQTGSCQLVACVPSLEPAVMEKAIQFSYRGSNLAWAKASGNLYYIKNGSLYQITIPHPDEKAWSDQQLFEEAMDVDKVKLASGINTDRYNSWKFSPNGENLAWLNTKEELMFYCHPIGRKMADGEEPLEPLMVERQVRDFWISDHALMYVTDGWELKKLPLAPGVLPESAEDAKTLYSQEKSLTGAAESGQQAERERGEGTETTPQSQTDTDSRQQGFRVIVSPYGDYAAVADPSTGLLRVFDSEEKGITLEPHMETHTKVSVQNVIVWEKPFTLEDIAGCYRIEDGDLQAFMEISPESRWSLFADLSDYVKKELEVEVYEDFLGQTVKINADFTLEADDSHGLRSLVLDSDVDWDTYLESLDSLRYYSQVTDSEYDPLEISRIEIRDDGSFYWITGEDYEEREVKLTRITGGAFAHEKKTVERKLAFRAEAQERSSYIMQEKERIKEEKRQQEEAQKRQALEERGRNYLRSGVYLPAKTKLYSYVGSSYSSANTSKNETWNVYDYQVDVSANRVWLKLKNTRNEYYWISR